MNYDETNIEQEFKQYATLVENIDKLQELSMEAELSGAIRGVSAAIDIIKKLSNIEEVRKNADIIKAIADIQLELATTEIELAKVLKESEQLKKDLDKFKSPEWQLDFDRNLIAYFEKNDKEKKVPYCPNCWDNKNVKSIYQWDIEKAYEIGRTTIPLHCPNCKSKNIKIPFKAGLLFETDKNKLT